jgi:hypothetical protein
MPKVGEKGPGGKIWAGSDYGWQSPSTVWKSQKPGGKVGEIRTVPGGGSKVWAGKDYGWQTQATIDKTKKGSQPAVTPKPAPAPAPTPKPAPAPAPSPSSAKKTPTATSSKPSLSSSSSSTAEKIKGGLEVYKKQVKSGDVKGAEETGKATWALANPKLAAAAAERERTRGTSATTNPQMAGLKDRLPAPKTTSSDKMLKQSYEYDAYDLVLEYLFVTGHADTVQEANYIMMQMDSQSIGTIVEQSISSRASNVVGHQRAGTLGDADEIKQNLDATSASIGKLKRGSGPKATPTLPGV